jgi:hypothetical protein
VSQMVMVVGRRGGERGKEGGRKGVHLLSSGRLQGGRCLLLLLVFSMLLEGGEGSGDDEEAPAPAPA